MSSSAVSAAVSVPRLIVLLMVLWDQDEFAAHTGLRLPRPGLSGVLQREGLIDQRFDSSCVQGLLKCPQTVFGRAGEQP